MKKILLSVASLLAFGVITAQVAKTPLIEHFTSASCPPCATQNAAMKVILDNYNGNFVKVSHQGNYSYDPMEDDFPAGAAVRFQHYNGSGVPHSALNGTSGYPSTIVTAATLAGIASQTTPYEITVTQNWISATSVDLTVVVANTTGADISTANKIFISMVEETVTFPSPPGSNGESQFHWVLRQMYDGTGGTNATAGSALGTILANGNQTFTFNVTPPSYISDLNQVSFAAYIQSATTNDMEQAGKSIKGGVPGLLDLSTSTSSVAGVGYCNYSFDPVINFTNNSPGIPVTQVIVEYDINGGAPVQETYNGNLTQGQSTAIAFPNTSLPPGMSTVNYNVVSVNGGNAYSGGSVAMAPETFAKINATAFATSHTEGFDNYQVGSAVISNAIIENPNNENTYVVDNNVGGVSWNLGGYGNSTKSYRFRLYTFSPGSTVSLIYEKLDFSNTNNNELRFSYAQAQQSITNSDKLEIKVSTDCGVNWITVNTQSGSNLATAAALSGSHFYPQTTDWQTNTVDLSAYDGNNEVMIAFSATSGGGNNLYIDDIEIDEASTTSISEINTNISVFPNPVKDVLTIEGVYTAINIYNVFGKLVITTDYQNTIDITGLSDGIYFLNIIKREETFIQKITIAK